jgi:uncharacterized protein
MSVASIALVIVLVVVLALLVFQDRLIYVPARYADGFADHLPAGVSLVRYRSGSGDQAAFFIPSAAGAAPRRLWLVWGGNGMVAREWIHHFQRPDVDPGDAFLLIDYPGYGGNGGAPSPETIRDSSEAAAAAVAEQLGWSEAERSTRTALFAHSMGCAAALQFAARHRVASVVLVAPFTDLMTMARRMVGWPLCQLLRHRFDNRARLTEILADGHALRIVIIHGSSDEVIPVAMGRALAAEFPAIRYDEVSGADHNGIIDDARERILSAMAQPQVAPTAK